jgi:mitochondrial import inner membrane translocase subunit TIM21
VLLHPFNTILYAFPIKGYGEETRRKRRGHVASSVYQKDGRNFMRMQFYVQGIRNKATAHLEMKEVSLAEDRICHFCFTIYSSLQNSAGNYECRYLFVQLDYYPQTTIIIEDNRHTDQLSSLPALNERAFN